MERFIVSARKYRPTSFETLIGQENIAKTLKNSILKNQLAHAYLFCGPRGVGKTTSARIFAKTINCLNLSENMDPCGVCESCIAFDESRSFSIHELDAASNNSVDDIRLLNEKVRIPPQIGKYSVYIIDEVHMLSPSAFNAFLKTLEEPPAHAIFILATTEKHKIIPTILSRCQTYDFNRISVEDIVKNLTQIAEREKIKIETEAMHIIARKADGAMRDALTLFDQSVAFCGENITYDQVISNLNVLDYEYYIRLTNHLLAGEHTDALLIFDEILSKGFNALHFIGGLSTHLRDLLICKDERSAKLLELAPSLIEKYVEQSRNCPVNFLYNALNVTTTCEAGFKQSGNQRLHIEFALVKLARINTHVEVITDQIPEPKASDKPVINQKTAAPAEIKENPVIPVKAEVPEKKEETVEEKEAPKEEIPAVQPKNTYIPSTPSIKGMIKKVEEKSVKAEHEKPKELGESEFDLEMLEKVWEEMAEAEVSLPRLKTALSQIKPKLDADKTVHFRVVNDLQKSWIEKNCKTRLLAFLRDRLDNRFIELVVEVESAEETKETKLYMPEEKAKFLLENYPEMRELQKDLKLEIK